MELCDWPGTDFLIGDEVRLPGHSDHYFVVGISRESLEVATSRDQNAVRALVLHRYDALLRSLELPVVGDIYQRDGHWSTVTQVRVCGGHAHVAFGNGLEMRLDRHATSLQSFSLTLLGQREPLVPLVPLELRQALAQHWPDETGGYVAAAARVLRSAAAWRTRAAEQTARANALADKLTVVERELREKRADYDELVDAQRRQR